MSSRAVEPRLGVNMLAWTLAVLSVAGLITAAVVNLYNPGPGGTIDSVWFLAWLGFPIVGAVIVSRLPRNRLGWLLNTTGVGIGLAVGLTGAILLAIDDGIADPWVPWVAMAANPLIAIGFLSVPFVLLLFPDDQLSGLWAILAKTGAVVAVASVMSTLLQPVVVLDGRVEIQNPIPGTQGVVGEVAGGALAPLGFAMVVVAVLALAKLVTRYRRSTGVERLQMKWVAFAAALFPPLWLSGVAISYADEFWGQLIVYLAFVIALEGIAVAIAIAVLRYRLFDIDVVINKTLVFGSLAVLITVVYVGIVVGVGALVGSGEEPSLLLSILATSVVAVGFQPARRRLQRIANRIVFGERATPYEVLASFSHEATSGGDVFSEVARLLVEGTAAEWVVITREGSATPLAVWPEETGVDDNTGVHRTITHEDEVMGELRFGVAAGESLTSQQTEVVDHLVSALGLLLANTRLTFQLQERVSELESSRARIVAAGDEVRRSIETQLEEGPLATLEEITNRLDNLDVMSSNGGKKTYTTIQSVTGVVQAAKQAVIEFAQGVFPPVLEEHGLAGALQQRAETAPIPVTIHADLTRRYPLEVEAALYFTAAEALQNTIKYANATRAEVRLAETNGALMLTVSDNGDGYDPDTVTTGAGTTNITERITALDGHLEVESAPGQGTTLKAAVPVAADRAVTPL